MYILLATLAVVATFAQASIFNGTDIGNRIEECGEEAKVDVSIFSTCLRVNPKIYEQHDYRCHSKCMYLKAEAFTPEGKPINEALMELNGWKNVEKMTEVSKKCVEEIEEADICDKVFRRKNCIIKGMMKKL